MHKKKILGINMDFSTFTVVSAVSTESRHVIFIFLLYQDASASASPKYVKPPLFFIKTTFFKIKVAVFLYMFYC